MAEIDPQKLLATPWLKNVVNIGMICKHWADIEYTLSLTIWHLLKLDPETGKIVTGGLDMQPRANMALNLARHTKQPPPFIKALVDAREAIQGGLDMRRNRAIHGVMFLSDGFTYETEVHRGRGGRQRQPLPASELNSLCDDLLKLYTKLRTSLSFYVPLVGEAIDSEHSKISSMISDIVRSSPSSPK